MPSWSEIEDAARENGADEATISVMRQKYEAGAYGGNAAASRLVVEPGGLTEQIVGKRQQPGPSLGESLTRGFLRGLPGGMAAGPPGTGVGAEEYQGMVQDRAQKMASFDSEHPVLSAISGPIAGAAAAGDTMTSGYASRLAGAVLPGISADEGAATVDALRQQYPAYTFAGDLYGGFRSPVARAGGQGGASVAEQIGERINSLSGNALGRYAAESFLVRAARNAGANLVAGGTAAGAYEGSHAGYGDDFRARLSAAADAVTNPLNAALSVGLGAATAGLQVRQANRARAISPVIQRYEAITGQRLPVSIYTDNQALHKAMDAMARVPELADDVARVREQTFSGMREFGQRITERLTGGTVGPRRPAAQVIRDATGRLVGERPVEGAFTQRREAIQERFFRRYGNRHVAEPAVRQLLDVYDDVVRSRPRGIPTTAMDDLFNPIAASRRNITRQPPAETMASLEAIRKQLVTHSRTFTGEAPPGDKVRLDRGGFEARRLYGAVLEAMNQTVPTHFDRVNRISQYFHRIEESFAGVKPNDVDDKLTSGFWESKNVLTAWRGQARRGNPMDTESLRGEYLYQAMSEMADPNTGLVSEKRLAKALRSSTKFNAQVMDEVIPGLRQELHDIARLSSVVRDTFPAEGSQTAGRAAVFASQASRAAQIASLAVGLFTNPYSGVATSLGIGGIRQAIKQFNRSMISGSGQDMMQAMARSGVAPTISAPQAAAQAAGGLPRAIDAGAAVAGEAASTLGGIANYATGALNKTERRESADQ